MFTKFFTAVLSVFKSEPVGQVAAAEQPVEVVVESTEQPVAVKKPPAEKPAKPAKRAYKKRAPK